MPGQADDVRADEALTTLLRERAMDLGADLVGVANVERYANAPLLLSPQGHFPEARAIVVVALHHTDAAVEMGGRPTPHDLGPYNVQNTMNSRNEHIVWELARFLEEHGWRAMPMPATNVWRFRPYGDIGRPFVPDISNIHAAAAAGLGEIGYSGLLLTPEFGPRQRFCTLITDAPLVPSPLYRGEPLCDLCMACAEHCPTEAFSKEVSGDCEVAIDDKVMRYPNKNIWRCAWAEHFGLDVDLPKPERVDEAVIHEYLGTHGRRGGAMGSCLRFCLPPQIRHRDPAYTDTVRRRLNTTPASNTPDRPATWSAQRLAFAWWAEGVWVADAASCRAAGVELHGRLPDARTLVAFCLPLPSTQPGDARPTGAVWHAASDFCRFAEHDIARELERRGYAALPCTGLSEEEVVQAAGIEQAGGGDRLFGSVITSAPLQAGRAANPRRPGADLWVCLQRAAGQRAVRSAAAGGRSDEQSSGEELLEALPAGIDMVGFCGAGRLASLARQLEAVMDVEAMRVFVTDEGSVHGPVRPRVRHKEEPIIRAPQWYLPNAQTVIVVGVHLPAVTIERATLPPAEAVGPYAYAVYQGRRELRYAAYCIAVALRAGGYRAVVTDDLMGTASYQANPRGPQPDFRSSRFAAVAAGLGHMTHTGAVWTPEWGVACLFISIVTDAPLASTPLLAGGPPCEGCDRPCVDACPTGALRSEPVCVEVEGRQVRLGALDWLRCEWAHRYGLVGDEGPRWIGSSTDIPPPNGTVTVDALVEAYAALDPTQKHWMCVAEPCLRACHMALAGRSAGSPPAPLASSGAEDEAAAS